MAESKKNEQTTKKEQTKQDSKKKKKKGGFDTGKQVRSLSLKFYAEQLLSTEDRFKYLILRGDGVDGKPAPKEALTYVTDQSKKTKDKAYDKAEAKKWEQKIVIDFKAKVKTIDGTWHIYMIYHNLDTKKDKDDKFDFAYKKGHFHVAMWREKDENGKYKRFRIKQALDILGLNYMNSDESMWANRGAELIRDRATLLTYFLHKTPDAEEKGKTEYDETDIATNCTQEELKGWLHAYKHRREKKSKLSQQDWDWLAEDAYKRGLQVKDFDKWTKEVLHVNQRASGNFRVLREEYSKGLAEGVSKLDPFARISIVIWGKRGDGKSYTTKKVLDRLGLNIVTPAAGTGKYDEITPQTDALFFDDVGVSQAKNVFDNKAVVLHRRNQADRPWLGRWAVATTNSVPENFIRKMAGIYTILDSDLSESQQNDFDAVDSRIYVCHVDLEKHKLICDSKQTRGQREDWHEHDKGFSLFQTLFNEEIADYTPQTLETDDDPYHIMSDPEEGEEETSVNVVPKDLQSNLKQGTGLAVTTQTATGELVPLNVPQMLQHKNGLSYKDGAWRFDGFNYAFKLTQEFAETNLKKLGIKLDEDTYYFDYASFTLLATESIDTMTKQDKKELKQK